MQSLEARVKSVFSSKVAKGLFASLALAAAANAADLGISPAYRQYAPQDEEKKAGMPNEILRLAPKSNYARSFSFSFTGNTNNLAAILEDDSGTRFIVPPPAIAETNGAVTVTYCIPSVLRYPRRIFIKARVSSILPNRSARDRIILAGKVEARHYFWNTKWPREHKNIS